MRMCGQREFELLLWLAQSLNKWFGIATSVIINSLWFCYQISKQNDVLHVMSLNRKPSPWTNWNWNSVVLQWDVVGRTPPSQTEQTNETINALHAIAFSCSVQIWWANYIKCGELMACHYSGACVPETDTETNSNECKMYVYWLLRSWNVVARVSAFNVTIMNRCVKPPIYIQKFCSVSFPTRLVICFDRELTRNMRELIDCGMELQAAESIQWVKEIDQPSICRDESSTCNKWKLNHMHITPLHLYTFDLSNDYWPIPHYVPRTHSTKIRLEIEEMKTSQRWNWSIQ